MFRDREDAGIQLAEKLRERRWSDPVVLAIPRGGVVVGAVLARELGADLDVLLSRKLRNPDYPELSIGAVSEGGSIYLTPESEDVVLAQEGYLSEERHRQLAEIARQRSRYRERRPPANVGGRSVIVTDDGMATGSTMKAGLTVIRALHPAEIVVAVPVAPREAILGLHGLCNDVVCLLSPEQFWAVGQFYESFVEIGDEKIVGLLRAYSDHSSRCV